MRNMYKKTCTVHVTVAKATSKLHARPLLVFIFIDKAQSTHVHSNHDNSNCSEANNVSMGIVVIKLQYTIYLNLSLGKSIDNRIEYNTIYIHPQTT